MARPGRVSHVPAEVTLSTERQIEETVARCVGVMVYYHNAGRAPGAAGLMTAEVQSLAACFAEMGLKPSEAEARVHRPVEAELAARYGPELGPKLGRLFREAFDGSAPPREGRRRGERVGV